MSGCSFSNPGTSCERTSPSRPMAQMRRVVLLRAEALEQEERSNVSSNAKAPPTRRVNAGRNTFTRMCSIPQPSTCEARPFQTRHHVRILAHRFPDQTAAIVLDHRDDRTLIDSQIVGVEPAYSRYDLAMVRLDRQLERRIVGIDESVIREEVVAILLTNRH